MSAGHLLRHTQALCPVCFRALPAAYRQRADGVYLERECPAHGLFHSLAWRGEGFLDWLADQPVLDPAQELPCPEACGLCAAHQQQTCCVLLEITERCNLHCPHCFAAAAGGPQPPSLQQLDVWIADLVEPGQTLLQLSGGEPTTRPDLPQIIRLAKEHGCAYIQLNSNGIKLAESEDYVAELAEAGLSFVFLQFDGTEDAIYEQLRGRPLLEVKQQAIANCGKHGLGVTLVPMLVPGVNTHNIGAMVRFAVAQSPTVRGLHFQPVSYLGRAQPWPEDSARYTLPELVRALEEQTAGLIQPSNLLPSRCDHPLCGLHGDFVVLPAGLYPLTSEKNRQSDCAGDSCCCGPSAAAKNRQFVARRWLRQQKAEQATAEGGDMQDLSYFLNRVKSHGFTLTAMAFQDAGHLDVDRLRHCSLHVYREGKMLPFCSHYSRPWPQP